MNKVNNARNQQTRVIIRNTLIDLLDREPFTAITPSLICQQAGINRSTFYSHYRSIADVLADFASKIDSELLAVHLKNPDTTVEQRFSILAEQVKKESSFFRAWFACPENVRKLRFLTEITIEPLIHATPHQEYRAEYYQQGIEAILVIWLNGGFKETVQILTDILGVHLPQDLKESSNSEI